MIDHIMDGQLLCAVQSQQTWSTQHIDIEISFGWNFMKNIVR